MDGQPVARLAAAERGLTLGPVPRLPTPDPERFAEQVLGPARPVVLTDFAAGWPALARWSPQWLAERHGRLQVPVYDASFAQPGRGYMSSLRRMEFGQFLNAVLNEHRDLRMFLYNVVSEVPALAAEVPVPTVVRGFSRRFVFMFFGCRGSVTPIHYDIDLAHVFHTALHGRRRVVLFGPGQSRRLYRHPFTVRSYVDVHAPDYARYPALREAQGQVVTLEPGETLFMPAGWWHEVSYLEGGYGLSLRLPSERLGQRLAGLFNLALVSPLDRLMNRLAPAAWYGWKSRAAERLAREELRP